MLMIIGLACGIFGFEMVNSSLSYKIKKLLYLDKFYPQIELLSKYSTYKKLFEKNIKYLFPIAIILIIYFKIHNFIYELLSCPYCTSFWVGLFVSLLFGYSNIIVFVVANLSLLGAAIYSRLKF